MSGITYPLYLVLDASGSMDEDAGSRTRMDLALEVPKQLLTLYEEQNTLVENLKVCVLVFNRTVSELLPLSNVSRLASIDYDVVQPEGKTFFSQVFFDLSQRIPADVKKFSGSSKVMKPAVVIVTDGIPSKIDPMEDRNAAWNKLMPVSKTSGKLDSRVFDRIPQVIMFGVATAKMEFLQMYATKPKYAIKLNDQDDVSKQIKTVVRSIKESVASSQMNPSINPDEDWLDILLAEEEDDRD